MKTPSAISIGATVLLLSGATVLAMSAVASDAGAFIGGVLATKVMGNMRARTEAEQQAYYAQQSAQQQQYQQQPVQQSAPAAPAQQTPQERLGQLGKLAAGGYITPDEHKQKKQAIIGSMQA